MNFESLIKKIEKQFAASPYQGEHSKDQLDQHDIVPFLEDTRNGDMPIFIQKNGFLVFSLAVPVDDIPRDRSSIVDFSIAVDSGFGYWYKPSLKGPEAYSISYPAESFQPDFIQRGIPLTSSRYYRFNEANKNIDLPQDLIQIFNLHRDDESGHFCRINENGDKEEIIKILITENIRLVTIKEEVLSAYLHLRKFALVRLFESMRAQGRSPHWTKFERIDRSEIDKNIYAYFQDNEEKNYHCSLLRGGQFIGLDRKELWANAKKEFIKETKQEYCDFLILDWKNNRITMCSCNPANTSNYFEPQNNKPYDLSPVFFKPQVLEKYKNNPDEYRLESRSLTKIDGWGLQTYDINEYGQVHTYLHYLSFLPYEEQLYWKSMNEKPKGPISKRAYQTDFKGTWPDMEHPDEILIRILERAKKELILFKGLGNKISRIHRVHTDNQKEWADLILLLDQLLIETMDNQHIKNVAINCGCFDKEVGTIKQLMLILEKNGYSAEILSPLKDLHFLRCKIVGHIQGTVAKNEIKNIRKKFKNYQAHAYDLLTSMCETINFLLLNWQKISNI